MLMQMGLFLFYSWIIFHCVYIPHLLYPFNCWWTLRLCPCLGYVSNAAMYIGGHISFQFIVFFGYMSNSGIAGSYDSSIFSFLRNCRLFSIVAVSIYILNNNVGGLPFLHTLSSSYYSQIFSDGHCDQYGVIPHCSFDLHFSND